MIKTLQKFSVIGFRKRNREVISKCFLLKWLKITKVCFVTWSSLWNIHIYQTVNKIVCTCIHRCIKCMYVCMYVLYVYSRSSVIRTKWDQEWIEILIYSDFWSCLFQLYLCVTYQYTMMVMHAHTFLCNPKYDTSLR